MATAVLQVDAWYSKCSNCNQDCSPYETHHDTVLGYGPKNGTPGCGALFTAMEATTFREHMFDNMRQMRPDLSILNEA